MKRDQSLPDEREKGSPLVSIIMPVYNGACFLAPALQSILDQQYRSFELIVVDDGSVDDTAKIVQAMAGVRYFHQSNQGVATARNKGLAVAKGEYIAFLDADDLW